MYNFLINLLKKYRGFYLFLRIPVDFYRFFKRKFASPVPTLIKHNTIKNHSIKNSILIETGTLFGDLIISINKNFHKCYTIEASRKYYEIAKKNLKHLKNVKILFGKSHIILNKLIKNDHSNITFYLDAHYSEFETFLDKSKKTIIERELEVIQKKLNILNNFVIIIDDFRCFGNDSGFPNITYLLDFCKKNNLKYFIENDTFIIKK